MKPVTADFVKMFFDLYGFGELPAGLQWWLIARPVVDVERKQYAVW